jgi:peptide/nickel transport system permease protein
VAPFDPNLQDLQNRLTPPLMPKKGVAFLGADPLGRDMLSRIIFDSRVSLAVAGAAVLLAGSIGVALGLVSGISEGPLGSAIMRIADIQFSVPTLVLALALVAVVGPGLANIIIVLGVSGWVPYARVMRAQVLVVKEREYIEAARGLGAWDAWLVRRHILPNAIGVVSVIAAIEMAHMMITEASLSFLGLGVPPGTATWGTMIADGRNYLYTAWWVSAFPGLAIVLSVVALNAVGDWLSDIANPVLRDW